MAGPARLVSARDQNPEVQLNAINEYGYDLLFAEQLSSRLHGDRSQPAAVLAEPTVGDTLLSSGSAAQQWPRPPASGDQLNIPSRPGRAAGAVSGRSVTPDDGG